MFTEALVPDASAEKASEFGAAGLQSPPTGREEKSATDLAAKLLLLDELVSLENDVYETKKKRSFPGFGSPLDRLSAGSVEHKGKQSILSPPYALLLAFDDGCLHKNIFMSITHSLEHEDELFSKSCE
ncbi:hypothetical protein U0070_021470 [Myodes glareolus]|uniref:Uncharacterized protein n=1 Tax=Myodes glareolus TaxID=447135 RepID=A0AAW0JEA3_MYOGA